MTWRMLDRPTAAITITNSNVASEKLRIMSRGSLREIVIDELAVGAIAEELPHLCVDRGADEPHAGIAETGKRAGWVRAAESTHDGRRQRRGWAGRADERMRQARAGVAERGAVPDIQPRSSGSTTFSATNSVCDTPSLTSSRRTWLLRNSTPRLSSAIDASTS